MTTMPASVIVAVDFSAASARAVTVGGRLAERCGVPLRLLHAETVEAPPYFTPAQLGALEQQRQDTRANTEAQLIRFGRQHTRYPFSTLIVDDPPATAILHEARQGDFFVMGTNGHRGARRWLVGSVGDLVLRDATLPVLFVPAATEGVLP